MMTPMKHAAMQIPEHCWVAVCDGGQALLLRNEGTLHHPDLATVWASSRRLKPTHQLGTSRPGRFVQPFSVARGALEQTDLHQKMETDLLRMLVARLGRAISAREADQIIVVASGKALGWLRNNMPPAVRHAVVGEVNKDLTHFPPAGIQRRLNP